jgi:hypothetical protein
VSDAVRLSIVKLSRMFRKRLWGAWFLVACFPAQGLIAQQPAIDPSLDIAIVSSKDGSPQRAIFYVPPGAAATAPGPKVPLVVFLHSWSTDYKTVAPALEESKRRGWVFAGPNFRGPNETPEACASDLAVRYSRCRRTCQETGSRRLSADLSCR